MSVGGTIGAVIGFYLGGPVGALRGYAIGAAAESILNPPTREGPRLDDLRVQQDNYGASIPFEWGTNRHSGTSIWPHELVLAEHSGGGKGEETFSYSATFAVLICEGPIVGVRRIWANKKLVYDASGETGETRDPALHGYRLYLGTETQEPDPTIEAADGPSPAYLGYAYVVFEDYDLTDAGNRPPSFEFEVITDGSTTIPAATTYGEAYGITPGDDAVYDDTIEASMDENGHLWVSTMTGHAGLDDITGDPIIDPAHFGPTPQVQEYDAVTKRLLWFADIPPVTEAMDDDTTVSTYPMQGFGVYSGGYYFVGRGLPGTVGGSGGAYAHGIVIDAATHSLTYLWDSCAHGQYAGSFYWPSVPVPVIDNNKVYIAGGNGIDGGWALGFFPASIMADPFGTPPTYLDYDPTPDRTGPEHKWVTVLNMWAQVRSKLTPCPVPPVFDGVAIAFPDWAFKSTVLTNPNAVIVQGYSGGIFSGASYLAWVEYAPPVTAFDKTTAYFSYVALPGSSVIMPPIAWDAENQTLWAFAGASAFAYNALYAITRGSGGIVATATGFTFPPVSGLSQGHDVKGMTIDTATGYLRVLLGGGFADPAYLVLVDPVGLVEVSRQEIVGQDFASTKGKMWDLPAQNKIVYVDGYKIYDIPYGAALDANQVALSTIVADICQRAELGGPDIDVTELTDLVDGYIVPRQMTARAAIEPLQKAFYFDAVESDDKLKFVKRGGTAAATIPEIDRAAHDYGAGLPDNLSIVRAQDLELPIQIDVEYPDIDADHLTGNQYDRRITRDTKHVENIQLPIVMTAEKAKQVAIVNLYQAWLNETYRFTTTRKYAYLEPTDIVNLPTQSATYTVRLVTKREQPGGVIEWEAAMEAVDVYTQSGDGAAPVAHTPQVIAAPGPTVLRLLDMPVIRDADDDSGYYVAMGGGTSWRGARLYVSADAGANYSLLLPVPAAVPIGAAGTALPDFTGGNVFDEASDVTVVLQTGAALVSASELQVLNGANLAAIGTAGRWEIVQYKNAALIAPNTYRLSGLLRGRYGTEWATGRHAAGDSFVLVSAPALRRVNSGDIGLSRLYKAPALSGSLSAAVAQSFTDTAVGLKPYAPVALGGGIDPGTGDASLTWTRRGRIWGGWRDSVDVPLSEASESYEVEIWNSDFTTLKRTLTGLSSPSATYTAAQQTADFGGTQSTVYFRVYQLSARVGRGRGAQGSAPTSNTTFI